MSKNETFQEQLDGNQQHLDELKEKDDPSNPTRTIHDNEEDWWEGF